jgi:putative SOS response-associated peptidase YedK
MCNHYEKNTEVISWMVSQFGDVIVPADLPAFTEHTWPKSPAPVLLQTAEGRAIAAMRWGVRVEVKGATKQLVKFVTNARDDKLTSFTWRWSVAERRCLIPAVAYYEPDGPVGGKWEVRFTLRERPHFFFAGLWDVDPDKLTRSFTMVTTGPNELAARIHDRMPLVLDDASAREWLGHTPLPEGRLGALCRPFPAEAMSSHALPPPQRAIKKPDLQNAGGELDLDFGS